MPEKLSLAHQNQNEKITMEKENSTEKIVVAVIEETIIHERKNIMETKIETEEKISKNLKIKILPSSGEFFERKFFIFQIFFGYNHDKAFVHFLV